MAKAWQEPTGRLNIKNRSFPEVVKDLRYCVYAIARYRPEPADQDQTYRIWPIGSCVFVAPNVVLTCNHVMNDVRFPHQAGDKYQFIQNRGNGIKTSTLFEFTVGSELFLYPDKDAAIIKVPGPPQPYAAVSYAESPEGFEIGVAGYPLSEIRRDALGQPSFPGCIYRVAQGVVTSAVQQELNPAPNPRTVVLNTVEVNFLFVNGNSGGPIFDAETGRVIAFVHGFKDRPIVQRYADTSDENKNAGAPDKHVQSLHAIYSLGIRLDNIRTELEAAGVTL